VVEFIQRTRGRAYRSADALHEKVRRQRLTRSYEPPQELSRSYDVTREDVEGLPCYTVRPRRDTAGRVLYLHGGGFVFEMTKHHWGFAGRLAARLDAAVTVPIFPLAPEHTCLDAYPALTALYAKLRRAEGPLTVMGDSTGATIALVLAQTVHEQGPDHLVLISPLVDATLSNPGIPAIRDPWLSVAGLRAGARGWAGAVDLADPRVSPLHGTFDGLGPTTIFTGTRDICHPDIRLLRERLIEQGVEVHYVEGPGLIHVFPLLPVPEAGRALERLATIIK
jgi:acetyl esterase/lipase